MNKFRVNLHPAFFENGIERGPERDTDSYKSEREKLMGQIGEQFSNLNLEGKGGVAEKAFARYTDIAQWRIDHKRFSERIQTYGEIWNQAITQWRWKLLMALEEEHYFEDFKTTEAKNKEISKIKEKYIKEVENEYIDKVWYADDNKFNSIKDKLFGEEDPDYPANKIYCKLTWASSILTSGRAVRVWYGIDSIVDDEPDPVDNNGDKDDKYLKRKDRNFLSNDLPEYLWNIRGKSIWTLSLGIVSIDEDRASKTDRKAIKQFLKAAGKITVTDSDADDNAIALMEAFRDNRLNARSWNKAYTNILKEHGITVDKWDISAIVKAWTFYINTQRDNLSAREEHSIYLSVLAIIEKAWGAKQAIDQNREKVEAAKKSKKEWNENGYENGEVLERDNKELYELAKKLWITDFASATRLTKKTREYFNSPVERILANLNNDEELSAWDFIAWWQKSWQQFLEMLNQINIGKESALSNLYQHAILENQTLWLNIEGISDSDSIINKIKEGDVKVILLLQNIISKPGEDLYTLLSWREEWKGLTDKISEDKLSEAEIEWKAREKAFEEAGKILRKEDFNPENYKNLFEWKKWVDVTNFADLQAALASCLYDNYKFWLWTWSTLTFEEWAKWLEIWVWAQVRNKWAMLGLNIWYKRDFDVGKGWTLTPGLSAWVFLPIAQWSKDALASAWLNFTADKVNVNLNTWMAHHYWFDAGFNVVTTTVYGWWHESRNKLEWLQEAADYQSKLFEQNVMWDVIDEIKKNITTATGDGSAESCLMNLNNPDIVEKVRTAVKAVVDKQKDIQDGDKEGMINGMLRMLAVYNNEDLNKKGVKYIIARNIAAQYRHSWIEQRKIDIENEGTYISWYSLWAFWKVWTPLVWAYATLSLTQTEVDGYGDVSWNQHEQQGTYAERWDNTSLDSKINNKLRLVKDKTALTIVGDGQYEWLIKIPSSTTYRVKVTDKMKSLMKKDNEWVYIDARTPIDLDIDVWTTTKWGEIIVGWKRWDQCTPIDSVSPEWFTDEAFDETAVSQLREGIDKYDETLLKSALEQLKNACPHDTNLADFVASVEINAELLKKLNEINSWKHKAVLTIARGENWLEFKDPVQWTEGSWLELKYESNAEMISESVKAIAEKVYGEALKVKNPSVLHEVKHKPWQEWTAFESAYNKLINEGAWENSVNETEVKDKVSKIFEKLDTRIQQDPKIEFSSINELLKDLTGDDLVQALMSIKNIFARSRQVRWWSEDNKEYEFKTPNGGKNTMLNVIKQRYSILNTLKGKISDTTVKWWYESLFEATSRYVNGNSDFNTEKTTAAPLKNTVWFNLWDKETPENPLFDPEIYEPMVNLDNLEWFDENVRNGLHKRAMSLFAKNLALINPILKWLWLEWMDKNQLEELVDKAVNWEGNNKIEIKEGKCVLTLDIGGKIYKIKAWMKFWFFTQCVNHTIILDDIGWEWDGNIIEYKSWLGNEHISEWTGGEIMASTKATFGISVALWGEESQKSEEENSAVKTEWEVESTESSSSHSQHDGKDDTEGATDTTAWDGSTSTSHWGTPW